MGSIQNKNNWNNASKRLFGSYSHSGIPGFPFRNIFLFRNIPNERALRLSLENVWKSSSGLRNNFGKSSENFVVGNLRKIVISMLVCLYNKQNNTWLLRSLARYQGEHLKRNSKSRCAYIPNSYTSAAYQASLFESRFLF